MTFFPRLAWGARPRKRHPGTLDRRAVIGTALHWPAMGSTPAKNPAAVRRLLRGWQTYHMDTHGWSDIAYQHAIDQWGHNYRLRGRNHRSAANGNTALNLTYGAVLLVLAEGEEPSKKMLRTLNRILKRHRRRYPNHRVVVGHGDIRPGGTACPGPAVNRLISEGVIK